MRGPGGRASPQSRKEREKDEKALYGALAKLSTPGEAARFLRDLATPAEIEAFAERWRIARMLAAGDHSYREIAAETGASTTTIGRVARFLNDEDYGGYRLILNKTKNKVRNAS